MASAACAQGLTTLGFTGHSYTQRDREYCMSPSRTAQYKATIAKLKTEYKGKVDILCGIEWDLLSEDKRTGYDYWIGSAHHLRKDFYPGAWLLGEWQKMGGKVIITSDAHDVDSLTFGFDEAAAAVKAAGFKSVEVLTINGFETQEL